MRSINIAAERPVSCPVVLGYRGENKATEVVFDFTPWTAYGTGTVSLVAKRYGDTDAYPIIVSVDGTAATWTVSNSDTGIVGPGECEWRYTVGNVLVKSEVFQTAVLRDIGAATEEPPEPYDTWLETLMDLAAKTQANAGDAEKSAAAASAGAGAAVTAQGEAESAQKAAEAARGDAEKARTAAADAAADAAKSADDAQAALRGMVYVTFSVDRNGHVLLGNGDLTGTTSFALTSAGHMEVTY